MGLTLLLIPVVQVSREILFSKMSRNNYVSSRYRYKIHHFKRDIVHPLQKREVRQNNISQKISISQICLDEIDIWHE